MNRVRFITLIAALTLLAGPLAVEAQQAGKVHQLGYLSAGSDTSNPRVIEAFRQGLRDLGWTEGQNIVIEYRFAEGRFARLPDLAAELVRLKVDVMLAAPGPAALAARKATETIPIVFTGVADPVGIGLVASLARPGGNVTGLSYGVGTDTFGKNLELLKEAVPKVRRVAVLSNPASPSQPLAIRTLKVAAPSLGIRLQFLGAREPGEFSGAFAAMAKGRVEALLVVTDPMFIPHRARLIDLAARSRLPAMYAQTEDVEAGGLMSYGPKLSDLSRRAATYVDKILKGAKPADLPIEQPTKFELVINLKTAKALGLKIPESLLLRADEIIQ